MENLTTFVNMIPQSFYNKNNGQSFDIAKLIVVLENARQMLSEGKDLCRKKKSSAKKINLNETFKFMRLLKDISDAIYNKGSHSSSVSKENIDIPVQCFKSLEELLKAADKCLSMQPEFISEFPVWEKKREKSIDALREIIEELDKTHFDVNVARAAGVTACIAASIVGLVATFFIPGASRAARYITTGSTALGLAGGLTTAGASSSEFFIAKNLASKAQKRLQEEKLWLEDIQIFLNSIADIDKAIKELSVYFDWKKISFQLPSIIQAVYNLFNSKDFDASIKMVLDKMNQKNKVPFTELLLLILNSPFLINLITNIGKNIGLMPCTLDISKLAASVCLDGMAILKVKDAYTFYHGNGNLKNSSISVKKLSYGLLETGKLALNIVHLLIICEEIKSGSPSTYSKPLRSIVGQLEQERISLREIYIHILKSPKTREFRALNYS